jgi:transposase
VGAPQQTHLRPLRLFFLRRLLVQFSPIIHRKLYPSRCFFNRTIAPKGPSHVAILADLLKEEEMASSLPEGARAMFRLMLDLIAGLDGKIAALDKEITRRARDDEVLRRLMTVPGIGETTS